MNGCGLWKTEAEEVGEVEDVEDVKEVEEKRRLRERGSAIGERDALFCPRSGQTPNADSPFMTSHAITLLNCSSPSQNRYTRWGPSRVLELELHSSYN